MYPPSSKSTSLKQLMAFYIDLRVILLIRIYYTDTKNLASGSKMLNMSRQEKPLGSYSVSVMRDTFI